ncbi:MAG: hypothetical protein JRI68_03780 [Deltaproteobacteria bacterium]|nr:hypothetical protein [Deltaproteobacteria bacterium]
MIVLSLASADARAGDPAIAESLFRDGKKLMKAGDYGKACPKLAESQRLDPASGTMLAVALCHEREGKVATAWAEYLEADAMARQAGRAARSQAAQKRAAALEPLLAKLELVVDDALRDLPSLQIRLDGVVLESAVWDTAVPVDPGERQIEATAEGKKPWQGSVTITKPAERASITIGPLDDLPPEPAEQSAPPPVVEPEESTTLWVAGGVVGGLGVAALGVGTFFGVRALDQIGEAQDRCSADLCTDPEAVDLNNSGALSADLSTGLLIGGGVATAAGVALLIAAGLDDGEDSSADSAGPRAFRILPLVEAGDGPSRNGGRHAIARGDGGDLQGVFVTYGGVW